MQRSKSSRRRSSFTHRKRQRTSSAVEPSPDAGAEHESPPVDMALPAPGEEKQPAVIGTLRQVAPLLWDNDYMARFEEEADQLERRWGLMTAAKEGGVWVRVPIKTVCLSASSTQTRPVRG